MSSEMIWIIIVLILALLLLVVFGKPALDWIGQTVGGFGKQAEVSFSDCDLDRIQNEFDECPCIQRGETPHKDLLGCPVGTTYETSVMDRSTCFQYPSSKSSGTFVAECDGTNEECKTAKTKCDTLAGTVVAEAKKTGEVATNGDLELTSFVVGNQESNDLRMGFDLGNNKNTERVALSGRISNGGSATILHSFTVRYYICKTSDQTLCSIKRVYPDESLSGTPVNSLNVGVGTGLTVGNTIDIPKSFIELGGDADYCEADNECYLKVMIDADNKLSEPNEDNNERLQFVALENVKKRELPFTKLQIVTIIDDGTDGGIIDEYRLSDPWPRENILASRGSSVDGDLPSTKPTDGSCWVFTVDKDNFDDNVGAGEVTEGTVISTTDGKPLTLKDKYIGSAGSVVEDVFSSDIQWKAKPDGSLICSQGDWNLCSQQASDNALTVSGTRFVCRNNIWIQE